jgi:hypothetical protein
MHDTKRLRIKYCNEWPSHFLFPVEQLLKDRLIENNVHQAFIPIKFAFSIDQEFHSLLGHLLEGLDQLPYRPDMAFDSVWKALDAEFFRVKGETDSAGNLSRFDIFQSKIASDANTAKALHPLVSALPMQTCEFVAKRIHKCREEQDSHAEAFLKRVRAVFGEDLYTAYNGKYDPLWASEPETAQRRSGAFLRKLIQCKSMEIDGKSFQLNHEKSVLFLISVVMTQFRNERFHGSTAPPFRSSAAKLKTYAHAYFLFLVAYSLLLEVFLYRGFMVTDSDQVARNIADNQSLFLRVFRNAVDK